MAVRLGVFPGSIAESQDVDGFQAFGQRELLPEDVGLEETDPHASQPQFGGLQHHVVGEDGGVNIAGLLPVKGADPVPVTVGTDDNRQRRTVDVGGLSDPGQALLALYCQQLQRLEILRRGGDAGRFQNLRQLLRLHFLVRVGTDGAAFFRQCHEIHNGVLSFS